MTYRITAGEAVKIHLQESDPIKEVTQNIATIISTPKGSCPMYREFGLSMEFLDKPVILAKAMIVAAVNDAVNTFEPRASIRSVTFAADDNSGILIPTLEVDINE